MNGGVTDNTAKPPTTGPGGVGREPGEDRPPGQYTPPAAGCGRAPRSRAASPTCGSTSTPGTGPAGARPLLHLAGRRPTSPSPTASSAATTARSSNRFRPVRAVCIAASRRPRRVPSIHGKHGRVRLARWVLMVAVAGRRRARRLRRRRARRRPRPPTASPPPRRSSSPSTTQTSARPARSPAAPPQPRATRDVADPAAHRRPGGCPRCYERVTFEFKPQQGEADGPVGWNAAYEARPDHRGRLGPRRCRSRARPSSWCRLSAAGRRPQPGGRPGDLHRPGVARGGRHHPHPQVRRIGDFEGVLTWVIGIDQQRPFRVTTQDGPARVIVDVGD